MEEINAEMVNFFHLQPSKVTAETSRGKFESKKGLTCVNELGRGRRQRERRLLSEPINQERKKKKTELWRLDKAVGRKREAKLKKK